MYDIIFNNAEVITMEPKAPTAGLVAVKGDRIASVGARQSSADLKKQGYSVIDCAGKLLIPGFIDAHCHIASYAESQVSLNLSPKENVRSISDIQFKIREHCHPVSAGEWIRGKGYNEFNISEKRHPNRWDLDAATSVHPVKLTHRSGHAHVLNSLGLKLVGIGAETGDPPGSMIDRDINTGLPTGILYGMGAYLSGRIPGCHEAEIDRGVELANTKLLSCGITSVQDASASNELKQWKRFETWKEKNLFHPRVTMMLGLSPFCNFNENEYVSHLSGLDLCLGSIKVMAHQVTGSMQPARKELGEIIEAIHVAGFQAAIHAVEEPVVEAAANGIEYAVMRHRRSDPRHRIEHCSVCNPLLLERLAKLGCYIVTQPAFLFYEGDRYLSTVPDDQLEHLYPIDSMLLNNLNVGFGSDFPIADPNPLVSIGTAVTRRSEGGRCLPGKGVDLYQAIRMQTLVAAAACFEENIKGSIKPGKVADFVVLSENPFSAPVDRIKDVRVIMTVLGGRIVWGGL